MATTKKTGALSKKWQLGGRVPPEVRERFDAVWSRLKTRGFLFRDQKIKLDAIIACMALEFAELSEREQEEIIRSRMPTIEQLFGFDVSVQPKSQAPQSRRPINVDVSVDGVNVHKKKKGAG